MQTYKKVNTDETFNQFVGMMKPYLTELDNGEELPENIAHDYAKSIIDKLSNHRELELLYQNETPIGFYALRIDQPEDKGYLRIGDCFILEFYIAPQYRRNGHGAEMFNHLRRKMKEKNVPQIYLTTHHPSSENFWLSQKFIKTTEICPDNDSPIFIHTITQ